MAKREKKKNSNESCRHEYRGVRALRLPIIIPQSWRHRTVIYYIPSLLTSSFPHLPVLIITNAVRYSNPNGCWEMNADECPVSLASAARYRSLQRMLSLFPNQSKRRSVMAGITLKAPRRFPRRTFDGNLIHIYGLIIDVLRNVLTRHRRWKWKAWTKTTAELSRVDFSVIDSIHSYFWFFLLRQSVYASRDEWPTSCVSGVLD